MYMWQVAPSETGPFTGEPSNVDSYLAGPLEEDLWVRQVATSEAGCGGVASDPVLIDVLPDVTAPTISNVQLCQRVRHRCAMLAREWVLVPQRAGRRLQYHLRARRVQLRAAG